MGKNICICGAHGDGLCVQGTMGIKGGTDIKKDLRQGYPSVLFQEVAHHGGVESEFYTRARARVIDFMIELCTFF